MLDLPRVIRSKPGIPKGQKLAELYTPWGEALDPECVLSEHPNPQFARENYMVLNGRWNYAVRPQVAAHGLDTGEATFPHSWDGDIVVPFSPGTLLSGVEHVLQPDEELWYRREFSLTGIVAGQRVLLHFEAVDYACDCWVDGVHVGSHTGGYTPFSFDITEALQAGQNKGGDEGGNSSSVGGHTLTVRVTDPTDTGTQPRGKQKLTPGGIWYTPTSGMWQTVWLETVPDVHVESARLEADADTGTLTVTAQACGYADGLRVRVLTEGSVVAEGTSHFTPVPEAQRERHAAYWEQSRDICTVRLTIPREALRLWNPGDPFLYDVELTFGEDIVHSYCAFRSVSVEPDAAGRQRFCLNHRPLFLKGVLDQGYWSDGGMTAPSDEALVFDITTMKQLGFNLLRKHIKVESARWYYHCDRLGMLVMQDMVSGGSPLDMLYISTLPTLFSCFWTRYNDTAPAHLRHLSADDPAFREAWRALTAETITRLSSHPSIVAWCLFNEGWGQFDAAAAVESARRLDPTRPIDATSGWFDQNCGNFLSDHNYFRGSEVYRRGIRKAARTRRGYFVSEFGGLSLGIAGHEAAPESYGYGDYGDREEWRTQVRKLLADIEQFAEAGLSGYVYTQLSDVEEENNGILTYDRRVNKLADNGEDTARPTSAGEDHADPEATLSEQAHPHSENHHPERVEVA